MSRVSEDRITKLVTVESDKPILMCIGDHISVLMTNHDDAIWTYMVNHGLCTDIRTQLSLDAGTLTPAWKERLDFDDLEYTVYNVLFCAKLVAPRTSSTTQQQLSLSNMCQVLVPEEPRLYSFASVHPRPSTEAVNTFDILVSRASQSGCSAFLLDSVGTKFRFSLRTSFATPKDPTTPLVFISAGSGLGTFLPLIVNDNLENP